ncbi:hypothetical protein WJX81_000653 [Elliptochloris bilobata]|uniref:Nitrate reductase n=1 Tax=Elliptochloris bilobata TaxID=381761 RepID=A0AAW1RTC6_9CHLO
MDSVLLIAGGAAFAAVRAKSQRPSSPVRVLCNHAELAFVSLDSEASCSGEPEEQAEEAQPLRRPEEPDAPLLPEDPEWALHECAGEVDVKDSQSPDRWVKRHRQLIRLTGRHPLNAEPPLSVLMSKGFITPTALHYVRNHGAVPQLDWNTHRISVGGLVDRPASFSIPELLALLPSYTLPITLVCAGNRRKEQNVVRKSVGFNWGPAAVSTSYWTGVRLCDLLAHCGVHKPSQGARYVCFRGVQKELPQGKDGSYGTSLALGTALDPGCDVMLAYKQNGRRLAPDHGYPIRMIIPGHIGGRMVKWLEEITVTPGESDNFYHFHDNRVLPPGIDQERAKAEGWWFKPEYIINELNINAAFTSPAHDEVVPLRPQPFTVRGYAYTGGGRHVIRAEVSLDGGDTWRRADIERHEAPTPHNKTWCWVFWSIAVTAVELLRAPELRVRAVDSSQNMMPEKLTWNLMGMMNNPHYRVKVHAATTPEGLLAMRFEHPCLAGGEAGGWMEREYHHVIEASKPADSDTGSKAKAAMDEASLPAYTMTEVEKHASRESAWFVHSGLVYDATKFLAEHPGGAESILIVAGQEATDEFDAIHSAKAKGMLKEYLIGRLGEAPRDEPALPTPEQQAETSGRKSMEELVALNPRKKIPFKLVERRVLSRNSRLFRFALQSPQHRLGLPVGQHMFFSAKDKGEAIMRAYTPTSSDEDLGYFDLVIKVYFANEHPSFPLGGRMSQYMERMALGDTIDVKGPLGHFIYEGRGYYRSHGTPGFATRMSMIAGGTGITPMFQVIKAVLRDKSDATEMRLVYANQTEDDILLRRELDDMAKDWRLSIHYILSRPTDKWKSGSTGRVCDPLLKSELFKPGEESLAMMCGPPGMQDTCMSTLQRWGYTKEQVIVF